MLTNKQNIYFEDHFSIHLHFVESMEDALQHSFNQAQQSNLELFHNLWTSISQLDDEISCTICAEHYSSAMILPCGHSFCVSCLTNWQLKSGHGKARQPLMPCPVCQQKFRQQIPNRLVNNIVELVNKTVVNRDAYASAQCLSVSHEPTPPSIMFKQPTVRLQPTGKPTSVIVRATPAQHVVVPKQVPEVIYLDDVDEGIVDEPNVEVATANHHQEPLEDSKFALHSQLSLPPQLPSPPQPAPEEDDEIIWL